MSKLTFDALRLANETRVGQFRNQHGNAAHLSPNGSDWGPLTWLMALVGEVGEFAEVRIAYENGSIDFETYKKRAKSELADIQTYLDLLAYRALDVKTEDVRVTAPLIFAHFMSTLGGLANKVKKFFRGDMNRSDLNDQAIDHILRLQALVKTLNQNDWVKEPVERKSDPFGIDLGEATVVKFNEVSKRVGVDIHLELKSRRCGDCGVQTQHYVVVANEE